MKSSKASVLGAWATAHNLPALAAVARARSKAMYEGGSTRLQRELSSSSQALYALGDKTKADLDSMFEAMPGLFQHVEGLAQRDIRKLSRADDMTSVLWRFRQKAHLTPGGLNEQDKQALRKITLANPNETGETARGILRLDAKRQGYGPKSAKAKIGADPWSQRAGFLLTQADQHLAGAQAELGKSRTSIGTGISNIRVGASMLSRMASLPLEFGHGQRNGQTMPSRWKYVINQLLQAGRELSELATMLQDGGFGKAVGMCQGMAERATGLANAAGRHYAADMRTSRQMKPGQVPQYFIGKSAKTPTLSPRQKQWLEFLDARGGKAPGIDLPGFMRRTRDHGPVVNLSVTGDFTGLQRMGLIHINPDYYGPRGREVTLTPSGREAVRGSKALGEGLDTAGGYLVPAEHGEKPIELLRDGKSATAKAGAPTPPSGGKVQRQQANVTFDTAKLKADLWYGYTINYDFTTKAEVKRFMGQAQAAGFKLGATAQVLEGHARQEMGIPIGIDWQGTLARSKADMMKIAGRLNSEHPKNVMFKLVDSGTSLPHAKPSMAVYADQMNLGSVAFREHAQALYQLAKRIGSKVRSQNSSDMMPLSAAIRPTGKSVKAMPPLLPGGQGYSGKARASLRRAGAPPEEYIFHWTLEYEQAKEYTFQTAQQMTAFMATAKQAGYRIIRRAQPGEVAGQPADENSALSEDRTVLQARFPMIKERMEYGKGTTFIIEHHHGKGFRGFGMVKPPSGGPAKPTGIMINLKTEAGAKVMQSMAQAAGWQVKWR